MLQAIDMLSSTTECVFANNVAFGERHNRMHAMGLHVSGWTIDDGVQFVTRQWRSHRSGVDRLSIAASLIATSQRTFLSMMNLLNVCVVDMCAAGWAQCIVMFLSQYFVEQGFSQYPPSSSLVDFIAIIMITLTVLVIIMMLVLITLSSRRQINE